jgi:hypothetical protein
MEDCFFYIDESAPVENRTITVMCCKCRMNHPDLGWFWEGSKLGYGPFNFVCKTCGHVIYTPKGQDEETATSS